MKTYSPDKILYPCFIQPKLNGIYAELGTDGIFRSRTGKIFPAIQETWRDGMYSGEHCIRGELWFPTFSLQDTVSAVMPDKPGKDSCLVRYYAFDCGDLDIPQYKRFELLKDLEYLPLTYDRFYRVETYLIRSQKDGNACYEYFLKLGYEGAVYRPYSYGDLLKRKPFKDAEFECVAVHEGLGKRKGHVGNFTLRLNENKTFNCGGGRVSYKVLQELFRHPPIGKMITVRYQHTSDAGIPLCAQFIAVRNYE